MMKRFGWVASLLVLVCLTVTPSVAQEAPAADADMINLFFDCQTGGCHDMDFFRREIPFVNWVRDRESSDLHVLVTSQRTGGGGSAYSMAFIGRGDFEGVESTLEATTSGDATEDERRSAIAARLKLGLVRYVQGTSVADQLNVTFGSPGGPGGPGMPPGMMPPGGPQGGPPADDPWDFWVFNISGNGFVNGQSTSKFSNMFGTVSANRTTEDWKFTLSGNYSQNIQQFDIPQTDGSFRTVKETREDWGMNSSLVKSIGGNWAVGVRANAGSSTFLNQDFRWSLKPGIEYNIFPYEESSRRSMTLQYLVGPNHFDYTEETIFGEVDETRVQESLTARLSLVEPWGRWSTSVTGSHYMHDTDLYNVTVSGNFNIRLFKGFSIRVSGNYSWIRDQLYIGAGGATDEQVLLQQRQLSTSYRYFTSFGISYRFGSIFNNVVNPRFGGGGGEFIMF